MSKSTIVNSVKYQKLAQQIGDFIEYWGFKQVHGRIWTLIFLSPEPVDANFIKDNLAISKALTSMSLKDLLHYNVIVEIEKDKPGTQKYGINHDISQVILDIVLKRELKMLVAIEKSCESLSKSLNQKTQDQVDSGRMQDLSIMVTAARTMLEGMASGENVDFDTFNEVTSIQK